jgi:hypothetical protein
MSKVDLTLGESKTKDDLTLESKGQDFTWETAPGTWADHTSSTWEKQKQVSTLESKTKDDLTLETK